uniref:Replication factor C large subunit n=1 Tax=Caldiarchaeum subterraneum TaxID=311458 RepID=E6N3X2_CALS0|nr:replication factor C large subunit [Candidatus Caldarchaeum subterraneum]
MTQLWTEKHRPRKVSEIVGNKEAVQAFLEWMAGWEKGKPSKKAALLYGPAGVGKTSLVHAYAYEKGYEVIETNASDFRTRENIERIVGAASGMASLTMGQRKIILVDEVDGIDARADAGAVTSLADIISKTHVPVVLVANDPWDPRLAPLRDACLMIQFRRIPKPSVAAHLKKIAAAENVRVPEDVLRRIVENSEGDLRSAINDLQMASAALEMGLVTGSRDRKDEIFTALATIFNAKSFNTAQEAARNIDIDHSELMQWILENAPQQLSPTDLAEALENLAKADLYLQRINTRQNWQLLRYAVPMMTAGVALSRKTSPSKFVKFTYPEAIKFLGRTKSIRETLNSISEKVGKKLHMSARKARTEILPYLKIIMSHDGKELAEYFELSPEETQYLRGSEVKKSRAKGRG